MDRVQIKFADEKGRIRESVFETESLPLLRAALLERGVFILSETPVQRSFAEIVYSWLPFTEGASLSDVAEFTQLFKTLLKAGLPLRDALDALIEEQTTSPLGKALAQVRDDVEEGVAFSTALARHPGVFPEVYVKSVIAGEKSGALEVILGRLVAMFRGILAVRKKFILALIYPSVLLAVASVALIYLLGWVVPEFENLFQSLNVQMHWFSELVLGASRLVGTYFWAWVFGAVATVYLLVRYVRTVEGRRAFDRLKLRVPVLRDLEEKFAYTQFARTLATLVSGGIPLIEGLRVVTGVVENRELAVHMQQIVVDIERGDSFAQALKKVPGAPRAMVRVVHVGEESGRLSEMLENLANHYDEEIDSLTSTLTSLLEPLLFLGMALVLGSVIVAILLPVLSAAGQIK